MNQASNPVNAVNNVNNNSNNTMTFQIPPIINLHFEELKKEMQQFGLSFNEWINDKKGMLIEGKEMYLKTLQEETDAIEGLKKQYSQLQQKKEEINAIIEGEEKEFDELLKVNAEIIETRANLAARFNQLKQEFSSLQSEIELETNSNNKKILKEEFNL